MHASPRMLLAIPLALLLLVAGFTPAGANPPHSQCTSARQADGSSSWVGTPGDKVSAAALALAQIVEAHPQAYAGVEYCGNYSGVKIYVKAGQPASEVAALRKQFKGNLIHTVPVPQSRNDLAAATDEIALSAANSGATVSVTPDPSTGEVVIEQSASSTWKAPKTRAKVKKISKKVTSDSSAASRQADAAAFTSGAHIETTQSVCSLGPRIRVNGVYRVLTAGHCNGTAWYARNAFSPTSANLVGTRVTTSWPGNAYKYGDWQLLGGRTYSGAVYGGGVNSTTKMAGAQLNFNPLPLGHKLCSSGQTTGLLCYYTVSGVNSSRVVNGVMVGQLTWMTTGRGCSLGFGSGDSGGAMFYNNGSGKMVYVGLVTSYNSTECTFRFTQLSGIRAWNSTATW